MARLRKFRSEVAGEVMYKNFFLSFLIFALSNHALAADKQLPPGKPAGVKAATIIQNETPYLLGAAVVAGVISGVLFFGHNGTSTTSTSGTTS